MPRKFGEGTLSVHAGKLVDPKHPGTNTPIHTSTAYKYPNEADRIWYPRYFNTPGQTAVARKLVALEGGEAALIFSSGMAAISTTLLALCRQGDHLLMQEVVYGGTFSFVKNYLPSFGIKVDFFSNEKECEVVTPAVSLGGVESLICSPAKTSHSTLSKKEREKLGVTDTLLRLSVGIEDEKNLLDDLEQGLD